MAEKSTSTTTASRTATRETTTAGQRQLPDPALEPLGERMAEGQKIAKEAQLIIAERSPVDHQYDIGQKMGDEGAGQLSEWERRSSQGEAGPSHDEQVQRAALTPDQKAEKAQDGK